MALRKAHYWFYYTIIGNHLNFRMPYLLNDTNIWPDEIRVAHGTDRGRDGVLLYDDPVSPA